MPRYLVERRYGAQARVPVPGEGREPFRAIVDHNAIDGVTWITSFVSDDETCSFCLYDAPSPEAIRRSAARNRMPVQRITRVRVLDPYFHAGGARS